MVSTVEIESAKLSDKRQRIEAVAQIIEGLIVVGRSLGIRPVESTTQGVSGSVIGVTPGLLGEIHVFYRKYARENITRITPWIFLGNEENDYVRVGRARRDDTTENGVHTRTYGSYLLTISSLGAARLKADPTYYFGFSDNGAGGRVFEVPSVSEVDALAQSEPGQLNIWGHLRRAVTMWRLEKNITDSELSVYRLADCARDPAVNPQLAEAFAALEV